MIGICTLALLGSFVAPEPGPADADWELFQGLYRLGQVELTVFDEELAERLNRRIEPLEGTLPLKLVVRSGGSSGKEPRVLFARISGDGLEEMQRLLQGTLVSVGEGTFRIGGVAYSGKTDAFRITFEDPDRNGEPLTVIGGGADAPLHALFDPFEPDWRPALRVWKEGTPILQAHIPGSLEPMASQAVTPVVSSEGLVVVRSASVASADAEAYVSSLDTTFRRLVQWFPEARAAALSTPTELVVRIDPFEAVAELSTLNDFENGAIALADRGAVTDRGAAFVLAAMLATHGEPAEAWMRDAVGVAAAGHWWDRAVSAWVGRLAASGLAPSLEEVLEPSASYRFSRHQLTPVRAWLFENLVGSAEEGRAVALWRQGLDPSSKEALGEDFKRRLKEAGDRFASRADEAEERAEPYRGVFLLGAGSGNEAAPLLDRLVGLGVDSIAVNVLAPLDSPPFGSQHSVAADADTSDAALAKIFSSARLRGVRGALALVPLASPMSPRADRVAHTLPETWESMFLRYERVALHYALLAELLGCELYCLGSDMPWACNVTSIAGNPRKREVKRAGWERVLRNCRAAFDGEVTYAAGNLHQLGDLFFLEELDPPSLQFFPNSATVGNAPHVLRGYLSFKLRQLRDLPALDGRPVLLMQTGFASCEDSFAQGTELVPRVDLEAQERLYRALSEAVEVVGWGEEWFAGLFLWSVSLEDEDSGGWGFTPLGKPAERFVPAILGR